MNNRIELGIGCLGRVNNRIGFCIGCLRRVNNRIGLGIGCLRRVNNRIGLGIGYLRRVNNRIRLGICYFADDAALVTDSQEKLCRLMSEFGVDQSIDMVWTRDETGCVPSG